MPNSTVNDCFPRDFAADLPLPARLHRGKLSLNESSNTASRHHKFCHEDLDNLTVLISRLAAHADHSAIRARARWDHIFDFAENGEGVARPRRLGPADISTASDDS